MAKKIRVSQLCTPKDITKRTNNYEKEINFDHSNNAYNMRGEDNYDPRFDATYNLSDK
jgi:hypothetical protein